MRALSISLALLPVLLSAAGQGDLPRGPYLGQEPPSGEPELFGPGFVSTQLSAHSFAAFSPDGREVFWSAYQGRFANQKIYCSRREGEAWTAPAVAPFSGEHTDGTPVFSPDGSQLYFCSTRPIGEGTEPGTRELWVVNREEDGWSEPKPLGFAEQCEQIHFQCSVAESGNLYFAAERQGGKGKADIWCARVKSGKFLRPRNLGSGVNGELQEITPYVAPDESYLIFSSIGRSDGLGSADLYVSFRSKGGSWGKAKNLGPSVNTGELEAFAGVSPDGEFLFFESDREGRDQVFWVDVKSIEALGGETG